MADGAAGGLRLGGLMGSESCCRRASAAVRLGGEAQGAGRLRVTRDDTLGRVANVGVEVRLL